jgi:hypothetical protein
MFNKTVESERTPHRRSFLQLVGVAGVMGGIVPFPGLHLRPSNTTYCRRCCLRSCREPTQKRKNFAYCGGAARSVGWAHILGTQRVDRNLQHQ